MFQMVSTESVDLAISQKLRDAICTGEIQPGSWLNESSLADEFDVSRATIRAATRRLEGEGLVSIFPRRGAFVRVFTSNEISDLYGVRYALEAAAAEIVAARGVSCDCDALAASYSILQDSAEKGLDLAVAADSNFHQTLVELARNDYILRIWHEIHRQITLALRLSDPALYQPHFVDTTHGVLVESIQKQDMLKIREILQGLRYVGDALGNRWNMSYPGDQSRINAVHGK